MKYRALGRTEIEVSEIVFGAGWVGGVLIHHSADVAREALERARAGGINWVDTAPSYGDGKSEAMLGKLLPEIGWRPYLSTKFRIDPGAATSVEHQIRQSVERSLTRLGSTSVDLLYLHNALADASDANNLAVEHVLEPGGVADTLDALKREGVTRYAGFTANGDAESLQRVVTSGRFDAAQVYYNMLNPSAGQPVPAGWLAADFGHVIETCEQQGVGVFVIRAMAAGVLATEQRTGREIPMYESADMASEEVRAGMAREAIRDEPGTPAQTALRFVLDDARVSGVVIGANLPDHVDEAVAALDLPPLGAETRARLAEHHARDFGRLQ